VRKWCSNTDLPILNTSCSLLDSLHMTLTMYAAWYYLIDSFGRPQALLYISWSLFAHMFLTVCIPYLHSYLYLLIECRLSFARAHNCEFPDNSQTQKCSQSSSFYAWRIRVITTSWIIPGIVVSCPSAFHDDVC
jgi:hypothetical protein